MKGTIKLHDEAHGFGVGADGKKYYSRFAGFIPRISKVLVVILFMLYGTSLNAQRSWTWDNCVEWFRSTGVEYLAIYAHPTSDLKDYAIIQTSPDIIIEYKLGGWLANYNAKFKIVHGYNSTYGMHYFKDVEILRDEDPYPTFKAWDDVPKFHPTIYRNVELYHLYGPREFEDVSPKRTKAAVALMIEFLAKWLN